MDSSEVYAAVSSHYSAVSVDPSKTTDAYSRSVAQSFGYSQEELDSIPDQSNLGLSCGNPLALASLKEGETVIDLGSGGGFDVFLSAKRIGPTGRAIGVDMNKDMLALANRNKAKTGADNTSFVEARITSIPLKNATADVIISNCVLNLVPEADKQLVFNDIFRLLKPGGRVAVSDILAKKPLPEKLRNSVAAYVGCVAGASLVEQYEEYFKKAGFLDAVIKDTNSDLNVYIDTAPDGSTRDRTKDQQQSSSCCTPSVPPSTSKAPGESNGVSCCGQPATAADEHDLKQMAEDLQGTDLNEWIGSYKIFAVKP